MLSSAGLLLSELLNSSLSHWALEFEQGGSWPYALSTRLPLFPSARVRGSFSLTPR